MQIALPDNHLAVNAKSLSVAAGRPLLSGNVLSDYTGDARFNTSKTQPPHTAAN